MKPNMPVQHVYEYAVLRIVPRVEREEFVNTGVILFCKPLDFLDVRWALDAPLLSLMAPALDLDEVRENLCAFDLICKGGPEGGTIGLLTLPERFRWLTATRSTILQPSQVHPGYTSDPRATLEKLFEQLVIRNDL